MRFSHPYDGMLVSKAVVDGLGGGESKYTRAQRLRYFRNGMKHFSVFQKIWKLWVIAEPSPMLTETSPIPCGRGD